MGVMACNREGCRNIMCDRYSHEYGYICDECYEELIRTPQSIHKFMETPKTHNDIHTGVDEHRRAVIKEFCCGVGDEEENE